MKRQPPPAPAAADLDFKAAIEADAEVQLKRLGFDDKFGRKRLHDLVHEAYVLELMTIAQMTRWFEIGLVTPQELGVVHPTTLMIDLRARLADRARPLVGDGLHARADDDVVAAPHRHVSVAEPEGSCACHRNFHRPC